jgi:hypothetical protein
MIVTSIGYVAGITLALLWFVSRGWLKNVSAEMPDGCVIHANSFLRPQISLGGGADQFQGIFG